MTTSPVTLYTELSTKQVFLLALGHKFIVDCGRKSHLLFESFCVFTTHHYKRLSTLS